LWGIRDPFVRGPARHRIVEIRIMAAPLQQAKRFLPVLLILLIVPAGLFVGWAVSHLAEWHPRAPRPAYRSTMETPPPEPVAEVPPAPKPTAPLKYHSDWTTFEVAMAESKLTGKPVLIDFTADWCVPCRVLKTEVFDDAELARQVQELVIPVAVVDRKAEQGHNSYDVEYLQDRYGAEAFPTLVIVSARTGYMTKTSGYGGRRGTLTWIQEGARAVR
jgi:thiol:disulfide interchange protein